MKRQELSPASQKLALLPISTPPAQAVFFHQASVLQRAGLSTREELAYAASYVPPSGPFLFIPKLRAERFSEILLLMSAIATAYRSGMASRVGLKHPVHDVVETSDEPYFITGYDETLSSGGVSAEEYARACKISPDRCSPLTAVELAYRLLYFPEALDKTQFAAAGSYLLRGEEVTHVPVFLLPEGSGTLVLDSFLREHHSKHTVFPSCRKRVPQPKRH